MKEEDPSYSVIEYVSSHSGYKCGYCKSEDTNFSHGMWAHRLTVGDYQELINRGWRRSGQYCYKPTMDKTCCPQYTIRCDALNFKLSKSQKKVLKRMHAYLASDKKTTSEFSEKEQEAVGELNERPEHSVQPRRNSCEMKVCPSLVSKSKEKTAELVIAKPECPGPDSIQGDQPSELAKIVTSPNECRETQNSKSSFIKPGLGADPTKPARKKAKLLRMEKRAIKLKSKGMQSESLPTSSGTPPTLMGVQPPANGQKSIEDFLNAPLPDNPAHRLEMRLLPAVDECEEYRSSSDVSFGVFSNYQKSIHGDPDSKINKSRYERFLAKSSLQLRLVPVDMDHDPFSASFTASYELFRSYQMTIHRDPPEDCERSSFTNFLVDGPLAPWKPGHLGSHPGYGPFHQQYWLDGELIAVGVLDILPHCVSSVYLFYNPKYSFLSLGTYSTLREIAMTRELNRSSSELKWYYMGFYIHSCPKMRYKGNYFPSFILCPETYSWVPIEKCIPKLDVSKYSKLSEEQVVVKVEDFKKVLCLCSRQPVLYGDLRDLLGQRSDGKVKEYLRLVGPKAASSLMYYCEGP